MTKIKATAKCPSCKWKFFEIFESDQEVIDLVHTANKTVDPTLLSHLKTHESVSQFLEEASKEVTIVRDSHKGFRGSFSLKYEEVR